MLKDGKKLKEEKKDGRGGPVLRDQRLLDLQKHGSGRRSQRLERGDSDAAGSIEGGGEASSARVNDAGSVNAGDGVGVGELGAVLTLGFALDEGVSATTA